MYTFIPVVSLWDVGSCSSEVKTVISATCWFGMLLIERNQAAILFYVPHLWQEGYVSDFGGFTLSP